MAVTMDLKRPGAYHLFGGYPIASKIGRWDGMPLDAIEASGTHVVVPIEPTG